MLFAAFVIAPASAASIVPSGSVAAVVGQVRGAEDGSVGHREHGPRELSGTAARGDRHAQDAFGYGVRTSLRNTTSAKAFRVAVTLP